MRALFGVACAMLAVGAVGCDSSFGVNNPSCDAEVLPLSQSLTYHIVQGPGDGSFAYAPGGAKLATISGSYDLTTGDFAWTEVGADGSWIDVSAVSGYGYANENGDLDIIGEREVTDVLGTTVTQQFRTKRIGCQLEQKVRYYNDLVERERQEIGSFVGTAYNYSRSTDVSGAPYEEEGTRWTDTSYSHTFSLESSTQSYTGTEEGVLADGTSISTYEQVYDTNQGEVRRVGSIDTATDGSSVRSYTQTTNSGVTVWDYEIDYSGDGSGTVAGEGFSCQLTFDSGDCSYRCPSGQAGNC